MTDTITPAKHSTSSDFEEDPILDDGVEMVIAYASLPTLGKVRQHVLNEAAAYGPAAATAVAEGLAKYDHVRGSRFFNSHPGVPHYSGHPDEDTRVLQTPPGIEAPAFLTPKPNLQIGGLIWPLPDGKWQYIEIMSDGTVQPDRDM